jgi:hypothetical protein
VNVARILVSLYPRPFKEHWGAALEGDAQTAGWRSWPNVLVSLLDMWIVGLLALTAVTIGTVRDLAASD